MELSDERLAALAKGRAQAQVVNTYLQGLRDHPPRRGRPRTAENALREREALAKKVAVGGLPLTVELRMRQQLHDLDREIEELRDRDARLARAEAEFVAICAEYSARRGLSKAAWLEMGVPARVLKQCGL